MKDTIRWGIVGAGAIAHKFAAAVENVEGAEVTAIASRTIDRAKEFAEVHGIPNTFEGYEEMAKSDVIDAVYIATLNAFHAPYTELFLKAGKHVLCEKPCMLSLEDLDEVLAVAKETGKLFTVHQNRRWDVDFLATKQVISSGEIGDVIKIDTRNEEYLSRV